MLVKPAPTATQLEGLGTRLCFIHDFVHGRLIIARCDFIPNTGRADCADCARNYGYSRTEEPSVMQIGPSNSMDLHWTLPKRRVRHQLRVSEILTSFLTQTLKKELRLDWTTGLTSLPVLWATHPETQSSEKAIGSSEQYYGGWIY